jgi:hypothetical protein
MSAHQLASSLFPNSIVWVDHAGGVVWIRTEPSAVRESDELHVTWDRWTNRHGRHCVRVHYWVKTNVEIVSSTPAHVRWVEPSTPVHQHPRPALVPPPAPYKHALPTRYAQPSSCRRRIDFDGAEHAM